MTPCQRLPCDHEMMGVRTRAFRILLVLSWTDQGLSQAHLGGTSERPGRQECALLGEEDREDSKAGTCPVLTNRSSWECALARNENAP